ncbi:MAG: MarR family transcriptional regulator [Erysipelotrichaceae bacterium]|nr:MarR family transcriptional regulator [Erysipelotrichaceae bacterium]
MREKLLESLLKELECMDPDFRRKVAKPLLSIDPFHFTSLQRMTLVFLRRSGPQPMNVIASFHGISKQQLTPIVESLEKQNMVIRETNPENRREVIVTITKKSEEFFRETKKRVIDEWMGKLDHFTDEEIEEIITHMHAINGFLRRINEE